MANRYAVATGNWSNVATWDGGTTLPQAADSVCANGYTVTIDQDVTVVLITTAALGSGAAGGGFAVSTARTITANITAGSATCLTASHASGNTVTVNGAITGGSTSAYGFHNSSTGAVVVNGNVTGSVSGNNGYGLYNHSAGSVTITGNVSGYYYWNADGVYNNSAGEVNIVGNVSGGGTGYAIGVNNRSTGTVNITGNVAGGTSGINAHGVYNNASAAVNIVGHVFGGNLNSSYGIQNNSSGTVSITGNVTGGNAICCGVVNSSTGTVVISGNVTGGMGVGAIGVYNASTGSVIITGDIAAGSGAVGVFAAAHGGHIRLDGSIYAHASGWCGVSAPRIGYVSATDEITQYPEAGAVAPNFSGSLVTHYGASQGVFGQAGIADVRNGTVYGPSNELTGTAYIPAAASVLYGVPVDATTGTAQVTNPAILQQTTIATLASQTSFTLTDGSADDDAYNGLIIVITDASTNAQKCVGTISDYVGSTKTITLSSDPAIFTMAVGDSVAIVAVGTVLSASGLDSVLIESGVSAGASLTNDTGTQITSVNARQAMAAILSAAVGVLSGVSSNTPAFKPGGKASGNTRISATVTSDGRTAVTLKVPD